MLRMLLQWILNAIALLIVSHYVSGFVVDGWKSAAIAVVVIGFLNATVGLLLKFASDFVPGFVVNGWKAALLGALALAVLHMLFGFFTPKKRPARYAD